MVPWHAPKCPILVSRSIITHSASFPLLIGSAVMKSIDIVSHGQCGSSSGWLDAMAGVTVVDVSVDVLPLPWPVEFWQMSSRVLAWPGCPAAYSSWWPLSMRSHRVSLSGIHMRPSYISNPLFSSYNPSTIFPSRVVPFAFSLRISSISLSVVLSVWISFRSSLSI